MRNLLSTFRKIVCNRPVVQRPRDVRLALESLEERRLLSNIAILQTNLVSNIPGVAPANPPDPFLLNPWGLSYGPTSPFWVSDNNAGVTTLYTGTGFKIPLTTNPSRGVNIPLPDGTPGGTPTGTVFNISGGGFQVTENGKTGSSVFLFATEDGTIVGWAPSVDFNNAVIGVDNSANPTAADGAVYKGLAIATDAKGRTLLYASNFRSGHVDVFGTDFKPATDLPAGAFTDPHLPKGYAPFDIQELNGKIFVTYALQNADKHDDVAGPGHGFVDMFNLDGTGETRVATRGHLDSPWGLAIAPSSWGNLAGDLLVGNFGNGRINAFRLSEDGRGHFDGQLQDPNGNPIQIDGLWALKVGNDHAAGSSQTVFFTAGLNDEKDGLFGSLQAVPKAKHGDDDDMGEDKDSDGGDMAKLGANKAGFLPPSTPSAAGPAIVGNPMAPSFANVFINPSDLQAFTPNHHGGDTSDFLVPASHSGSFDWSNDLLVKELSSL